MSGKRRSGEREGEEEKERERELNFTKSLYSTKIKKAKSKNIVTSYIAS